MSVLAALLVFFPSLAVTLGAARLFARRLDRLGVRFGFSESLIGLLTAMAADGPELSSALFALIKGAHGASVGVLVGSGAFNLAAMLGVSAVIAGCVRASRRTLALEGSVGAAITILAVAVLLRWVDAVVGVVLAAAVVVPYLVSVIRTGEPKEGVPPPAPTAPDDPTHHLLALIVVDLVLIVGGSAAMVQAALTLGHAWHISESALGVLALGPLTSLPNAMTGVRLGLAHRGEALVAETLNSNTINLAAGAIVPSLFVAVAAATTTGRAELWWLVGMTALTLLLSWRRPGLTRAGGIAVIAAYAGFVVVALA